MSQIIANREKLEAFSNFDAEYGTNPKLLGRWSITGLRLPDGRRLKLEVLKVGRVMKTSRQALERFFAATTAATVGIPADGTPAPVASPAQDRKRAEAANAELGRMLAK